MKKTSIAIMSVVLVALIALFGFLYFREYKPNINKKPDLNNVYIPQNVNESVKGKKVLIAELKEEDFKLYSAGDYVILEHGGQEAEFDGWSKNIAKEKPQMYYNDFDGNGQKELVIRALKEVDSATKENVYCLYVLFITKDKEGKFVYDVSYVDRAGWYKSFNKMLNAEMSQPKGYNNRIQFAMNGTNEAIAYDSKTGVAVNGHVWFTRALADNTGKYYKFKGWEKGPGIFVVDNDKQQINVDVLVYANYDGVSTKQKVGSIRFGLVVKEGSISIRSKSVDFIPNEEYIATDPSDVAKENWQCVFNNTANGDSKKDKVIDKISIKCNLNNINKEQNVSFSSKNDDSAAIEKVVVQNDTIKLYAKKGCTFAKTKTTSRDYSVIIKIGDIDCDTSYSASVETEADKSVLVYKLDKNYTFEQLNNIHIRFGV